MQPDTFYLLLAIVHGEAAVRSLHLRDWRAAIQDILSAMAYTALSIATHTNSLS